MWVLWLCLATVRRADDALRVALGANGAWEASEGNGTAKAGPPMLMLPKLALRLPPAFDPAEHWPFLDFTRTLDLGSGKFGEVQAVALQAGCGEGAVAVKAVNGLQDDTGQTAEEEAALQQGLIHPNVCRVFDHAGSEGDTHYILMEHLAGGDLWRLLHRLERPLLVARKKEAEEAGDADRAQEWQRLVEDLDEEYGAPDSEAAPDRSALFQSVSVQLLRGLAYLHAEGVWHRDIKPENLVLSAPGFAAKPLGGHLKIVDFGSARRAADYDPDEDAWLVGSADYQAPEMLLAEDLDYAKADVYAAGVTLYRVWHGLMQHPVPGFAPRTAQEALQQFLDKAAHAKDGDLPGVPLDPDLPAPFKALLARLLDPVAERRSSAAAALKAAEALLDTPLALPAPAAPGCVERCVRCGACSPDNDWCSAKTGG